jgi:hypothetical protein
MSANIRWFAIAYLLAGCGVDGSGSPTTASADSYQGAGSQWTAKLADDSTFMLLHFPHLGDTTADQLINGTDVVDGNGFTALTVTSSAGSGEPAEGATGSALHIAGASFVLAPFTTGAWVPMIPEYSCPGDVVNANLLKVKVASGWSAATGDATATFTYDSTSGVATLPARYGAADPSTAIAGGEVALGAGKCSDGVLAADSGAELFLSASGVVVHTQPANEAQGLDEVYFGLPQADAAIAPASLAGNYSGFLFADEASPVNMPIVATMAANGATLTGGATATTGTGGAQVTLAGAGAANGLLVGTLDTTGATGGGSAQPLSCAVQTNVDDAAQNIIVCAGTSQDARFASVILVSH